MLTSRTAAADHAIATALDRQIGPSGGLMGRGPRPVILLRLWSGMVVRLLRQEQEHCQANLDNDSFVPNQLAASVDRLHWTWAIVQR
jgi:uncharacterized heparinase superfamily protein